MPFRLIRRDRSLLTLGAGIFLVLLFVGLMLAPPESGGTVPTTYSAGSGGAKAAYRLLESLGYRVARWERPPAELDDPSRTTLVVAEPQLPSEGDREAMAQFLARGGRVIATGAFGAWLAGVDARPDAIGALNWSDAYAVAPSAVTRAARTITIAPAARLESSAPAIPLYRIGETPVVVHVARGDGEAFWWASATPLTNAGITAPGNLAFVLASIGPPDGRRVLWDEYVHGYRASFAATLLASPLKWGLVQFGLLAAIVLLTYARRSGPIVPGVAETRLSPLEFVRTLGALYHRGGAGSAAVAAAAARFRSALHDRFGIAATATADEAARLVAARRPIANAAALAATLRACDAARVDRLADAPALALVQALHDRETELHLSPSVKEPA